MTTSAPSAHLLGSLGFFALAAAASAQTGPLASWQGGIVRPSAGNWSMSSAPNGHLVLHSGSSTTLEGVDILLPPAGNTGVPASVALDLAPPDPTGTLLAPGAEMEFVARGTLAGAPDQVLGSLHLEKQPSGRVQYAFDLSPLGATTYSIEFWDGPTLLYMETGVAVLPGGGGPLLTPNCDAHPYCCWTGQVVYIGGHWYNAWTCAIPIDWQSQIYNANRVVVTPENPTVTPGDVETFSVHARGIPAIELEQMALSGFAPAGASYCAAAPNSTGRPGVISALGSNVVANNDLVLYAFDLPLGAFGYFVVSPFQAFVPNAGGSQGNLCVGASTGRYIAQVGNTGTYGYLTASIDLTSVPQPVGTAAVSPGETWNFQCWYRDANPGVTSNFTSGYSIDFQ